MKRSISILLCLVLIFSSFSFTFADDWGSSQITSVVNNVSSINSTLSNIYSRVNSIYNYLYDDGHSIAYWTSSIASWMQPIYTALTSGLQVNLGLDTIIAGLNEVVSSGGSTTYYPYLKYNGNSAAYLLDSINNTFTTRRTSTQMRYQNGTLTFSNGNYNFLERLDNMHNYGVLPFANMTLDQFNKLQTGYNSSQNAINWGNLGTSTFTPTSSVNGIYSWLSAIQAPVARLSYVLASDERIEAQETAAANEQAVVDNFIDSSGDGAVPTSSFSDVSGLSSGVSSNLSTDASPSQIWDIFNSDHGSWFSQETANQLDTTTRTRGSEFETPLLDQQMEEIYKSLGGGK